MARTISFVVLVVLVLMVGALFVAVMQQFLLPLFLALLLVVMFRPLHEWFCKKMPRSPRIAAASTTLAITLLALVPVMVLLVQAGAEAVSVASSADPDKLVKEVQQRGQKLFGDVRAQAAKLGIEIPPDHELGASAAATLKDWIAPAALRTTQFVGGFLFSMIIMLISLYFFFADGPEMMATVVKLIPMDRKHMQSMLLEFDKVSRAVMTATVLSSIGQGVLAGIGYLAVGMPHLFLLTAATVLLTFVPFVGAAIIWGSCSLWLYFVQDRPMAAILLAIWCMVVVGTADNIIKPYVLKGQSNLHPLLALLSVIGGIQALGPIGIFVGPMVVSFLYALLLMLRNEVIDMEADAHKKSE